MNQNDVIGKKVGVRSGRLENRDRPMVPSPKLLRIVHRIILGAGFNRQKIWPALTYIYVKAYKSKPSTLIDLASVELQKISILAPRLNKL